MNPSTCSTRPPARPITFRLYQFYCRVCKLPFWTPAPNHGPVCPECKRGRG
jgi:hypothetical protein